MVFITLYEDEEFYTSGLEDELVDYIDSDDKKRFVAFMQLKKCLHLVPECWLQCAFYRICRWRAVGCASALLNGETPLSLDVNSELVPGKCPLHLAAHDLCYSMVDLLIRHGARTNTRTRDTPYTRGNLLPLHIVAEMISHHQYLVSWRPHDSIFKLIVLLCLPQLKVPLDICRLLALRTEEVGEVFVEYLMEGKLVEMAVLLMVARDKIVASFLNCTKVFPHPTEGMAIKDLLLLLIAALSKEEMQLLNDGQNSELLQIPKNIKIVTDALLLLEVFENIGDKIETLIHMPRSHMPKGMLIQHVKKLLEEGGFVLEDRDINLSDIDCDRKDICKAAEFLEETTSYTPQVRCVSVPFSQDKIRSASETRSMLHWSMATIFPDPPDILSPDYLPAMSRPRRKRYAARLVDLSALQSFKGSANMLLALKKGIRRL